MTEADGTGAPDGSSLLEKLRNASPGNVSWSVYDAPRASADLRRILVLPRRPQPSGEDLVEPYTARFKTPDGMMTLRPVQAAALREAELAGGLLAEIRAGDGKTLISLLLGAAMGSKCTVLLIPPKLRAQLKQDIEELSKHWKIDKEALHVVTYSELSNSRTGGILEKHRPDLIICDEAHRVKNFSAACTKRFRRYFKLFPSSRLCAMSGTLISKSIKDFATLADYALGEGSPLPLAYPTLQSWADVVDPGEWRGHAGDLAKLCNPGESAREAFCRRLQETLGVIVSTTPVEIGASIVFYERKPALPPVMKKALADLQNTWCIGQEEITDALTYSRYARQLAAGLYLRWIWPRGEPLEDRLIWLDRRRNWHREVRQRLKASIPGQDSPELCERAADSGLWPSTTWAAWSEVKDSCKPETEAVWVSRYLVEDAVRWGQKHIGVIWVEHKALGEAIARSGNFPLFDDDVSASHRILHERGDRTIVASRPSFFEGANLQKWSKALITTVSSNPRICEQTLARHHRPGQLADEVEFHVYLHTPELRAAFDKARRAAKDIDEAMRMKGTGSPPRLSYAAATW